MNYFKWLSGLVALIPGLIILQKGLALPPGFSPLLLAALVEISCCFVVAIAWLNEKSVGRLNLTKLNRSVLLTALAFIVCLFCYLILLSLTTINSPSWGKLMSIPLWESGMIIGEGGFQNYYNKYGVDELTYLLQTKYKGPVLITEVIVYINFILIFVFLTLTFTLLWLRHEAKEKKQNLVKKV